jgi:hypothetical protein
VGQTALERMENNGIILRSKKKGKLYFKRAV